MPPVPTVVRRRRRGWLVTGAALSLIAAAVLSLVAWSQLDGDRSAGATVTRYFHALADGDAARAVAFAEVPPTGGDTEYLTSEVLARQLAAAPLSDVVVTGRQLSGEALNVSVRYRLGVGSTARTIDDTVPVVRAGGGWKLVRVASRVAVSVTSAERQRLALAGRPVTGARVALFPGALPVTVDSPALRLDEQPVVRIVDDAGVVAPRVLVTDSVQARITAALETALSQCLTGVSGDPRCPIAGEGRVVPGSLRGTLVSRLAVPQTTVALDPNGGGRLTVEARTAVAATWKVWNFENQELPQRGQVMVVAHAMVSLADLDKIYWRSGV